MRSVASHRPGLKCSVTEWFPSPQVPFLPLRSSPYTSSSIGAASSGPHLPAWSLEAGEGGAGIGEGHCSRLHPPLLICKMRGEAALMRMPLGRAALCTPWASEVKTGGQGTCKGGSALGLLSPLQWGNSHHKRQRMCDLSDEKANFCRPGLHARARDPARQARGWAGAQPSPGQVVQGQSLG